MTEDNKEDVVKFSKTGRKEAVKQVQKAKNNLQTAAESLGYENVREFFREDNIPSEYKYVLEDIANAYSYLDVASLQKLNPDDE